MGRLGRLGRLTPSTLSEVPDEQRQRRHRVDQIPLQDSRGNVTAFSKPLSHLRADSRRTTPVRQAGQGNARTGIGHSGLRRIAGAGSGVALWRNGVAAVTAGFAGAKTGNAGSVNSPSD